MTDSTRRTFLKTSSAAAAFGSTFFSAVSARAFASGDDAVRVGLVGCGGRGTGAAAQALSSKGKVKLVAVADAFQDAVEPSLKSIQGAIANKKDSEVAVEEDKKFIGFDAYKKLIDSDDVDLVILATPPGFRPIHFEYAVQKGKHVFMEKPVATDSEGVRRVLEAAKIAKDKDLKVGVGLQRRHQKCYLDYIKMVHDGALGGVHALRVYWNGGGVWDPRASRDQVKSEMEYQMRNWYYYNWLSGDHICEQHIHNLDVGNWIMEGIIPADPNNIWAQLPVKANGMGGREVRKDPRYGEIYDHHAVEYTFADGTVMMSQCRHIRNCWNSVTEHAHCTKGIMNLDNNPRNCEILWADGRKDRFKGENDNPYQVEHDDLFAAIRNGSHYNEAVYGATSTMTSILGRMCTYSGRELTMKDAFEKGKSIMPKEFTWDSAPPTLPDANGVYPVPIPGVTEVLG